MSIRIRDPQVNSEPIVFFSMGNKGSKPRKPSHSQHLPKVGSSTENQRLQSNERRAIGEVMGLGDGGAARIVVGIGIVAVVIALISWITWL